MLQDLKNQKMRVVGLKQTLKSVQAGEAKQVFLARDVDEYIEDMVTGECQRHGLSIIYIDTMEELGKACGISIGAATAAILKG